MADIDVERSQRAELQRIRRLAKRTCGRCGGLAAAMLPWGGQQVAICATCQAKLDGPEPTTPWCAFNEVHPRELQHQVRAAGMMIEARLMPVVETPAAGRRSLVARVLGRLGQIFRPEPRRGTRKVITGKSSSEGREGADPQELPASLPRKM